jgi:hypothetical protein
MKREILFKGKTVDNGKWVAGFLAMSIDKTTAVIFDETFDFDVIPESVGEFTGLHGKNGVKIFEGDLCTLAMTNCQGIEEKALLEIIYDAPEFKYKIIESHIFISGATMSMLYFENLEVIGNINDQKQPS